LSEASAIGGTCVWGSKAWCHSWYFKGFSIRSCSSSFCAEMREFLRKELYVEMQRSVNLYFKIVCLSWKKLSYF